MEKPHCLIGKKISHKQLSQDLEQLPPQMKHDPKQVQSWDFFLVLKIFLPALDYRCSSVFYNPFSKTSVLYITRNIRIIRKQKNFQQMAVSSRKRCGAKEGLKHNFSTRHGYIHVTVSKRQSKDEDSPLFPKRQMLGSHKVEDQRRLREAVSRTDLLLMQMKNL